MSDKRKVVFIADGNIEYIKLFSSYGYIVSHNRNEKPDLLCFTGGADVDPGLYNEITLPLTMTDERRDKRDQLLYKEYPDVPKVGICRGGQFLNVINGGAMWQHVNNHGLVGGHPIVNLLKIPKLEPFKTVMATSTHHQMMIAGEDAEIIAIAVDGTKENKGLATKYQSANSSRKTPEYDTEVVWYEKTRSLCFQPHPEFGNANIELKNYFHNLIDYLIWGNTK